jgi:uncharacterized protein
MNNTSLYWINSLQLQKHPEGGYFRETYRSSGTIRVPFGRSGEEVERNYSTAIYFLLAAGEKSVLHRIRSDEAWHFYAGSALHIYTLTKGGLNILKLGPDPERGEQLQHVVRANTWFGAIVPHPNSYTLAGCTVAPGFDFADFEMGTREALIQEFPAYAQEVTMLTNP